ncbi:zinc finger and BTB domain-containing protein 44-like isoform X3 [Culicoides brevitarsis]|uniref:zinc finger and BTB domain-containing protein 44-like isoform X3 n=1 Tax=Culicoides brevitarsis TaxID=469753 RepID=UPI00307B371F
MATTQQYSLKWNNYLTHLAFHFENLRNDGEFTDVTLCCEGKKIKAHKVILSACSTYFCEVFKENPHPHPVIIFKNVKYAELVSIIQFMYHGEVSVIQDLLPTFLQTAELLQVRGLTDTNLTESAKSLVAEEQRPAETLFLAVPQETNKILTALSSTPIKTVQATHVPHETYSQIRIEQPATTTKVIEHHVKPPTLVKRVKKTHTIQQQPQQTTQQVQQQQQQPQTHQLATVQTYETLGLDNDGELMETEGEVEFLQTTGLKMEMPEFNDVPSGADAKTTQIQESTPSYIQTSDNVTYQIIDGQVVKRTTGGQTTTVVQTQDVSQEQEGMDEQENESELAMYQTDDGKNESQGGGQAPDQVQSIQRVIHRQIGTKEGETGVVVGGSNTVCKECNRTFTSASALRRHTMSKHSNIGVKYQCNVCSMSYKTKWSLSTHISRYHRPAAEKLARKNKGKKQMDQENTEETEVGGEQVTEVVFVKSE